MITPRERLNPRRVICKILLHWEVSKCICMNIVLALGVPFDKLHSWTRSSSVDSGGVYSRSARFVLSHLRTFSILRLFLAIGRRRTRESARARAGALAGSLVFGTSWTFLQCDDAGDEWVTSVMSQQCMRLKTDARSEHKQASVEMSWVDDTRDSGATTVGKMPATRPPHDRPLLLLPLLLLDDSATVRGVLRRTIDAITNSSTVPDD